MGRSEDLKKLPRFDESPESRQRPEIPPPPRMPSFSPPEVGLRVAPPPLRGARPDTVAPEASRKTPPVPNRRSAAAPPPPVALSRSAPPPPAPRTHSEAPELEPVERIDMRSVMREPAAPPVELLGAADMMDETEVDASSFVDPDAPTTLHRIPKRNQDQPSIAPVSMSSDELIEVTHIARNNRLARVGYAAVFGATLVAALYVWRMQPQAAAHTAAAAVPQPFLKEQPQLIATATQPVIEKAAEPVAATTDKASAEKASAQAAAANQPASTKHRSSKESKSESSSDQSSEGATAAATDTAPAQHAEPAQDKSAEPAVAPTAAAEEAPELPPFNQAAAQAALDAAAGRAAGCLQPGEPEGMARVVVTFAPSGNVTVASVDGPPFAGTPTGGCIARAFRSAHIPPFSGKLMTVGKTVTLR